MAKAAREPIKEVLYSQEDDPEVGRSLFRSLPKTFVPTSSWTRIPSPSGSLIATDVRLCDDVIQYISIEAHGAGKSFRLRDDDPILVLWSKVKRLRPLRDFYRGISRPDLYFGISRRNPPRIYIRRETSPSRDADDLFEGELAAAMEPLSLGIEDSEGYLPSPLVRGAWWVSYLTRFSQAGFEAAYERLIILEDWLHDAEAGMYRTAERALLKRVARYVAEQG